MKILICTDGSAHAEDALRFAGLIVPQARGPVKILGVAESAAEEVQIRQVLSRASQILGEVPSLVTKARRGHAAEEILRELEEGEYDLAILGARGRRGITRFLLGSTALRVVEHAPASVLIVRQGRAALKRILVATAGGEPGERDVDFAGRLAHLTGAQVTVLHVLSRIPVSPQTAAEEWELPPEVLLEKGTPEAAHLKRGLDILATQGVEGRAVLRRGLVVDEILAEAKEGDYDLLVVGAHAARGIARFLLDDVTRQILTHVDRPVVVVRARASSGGQAGQP